MGNPNPNPKNNEDQDPHFQSETPNPLQDQETFPQIKPQEPEEKELVVKEPEVKEPEGEKEAELQQAGMDSAPPSPQNTVAHITIPESEPDPDLQSPPLTSPTSQSLRRRGGVRKRKPVPAKRKQALAKKVQSLSKIFKPVPFSPRRSVDFSVHEKLLKRLGLWDFVHVELDRDIRTDVMMQFIVSYDPKTRIGHVNDFRVQLARADLARAMKLPMPKKGKMNTVEVEGEEEAVSDEAKAFVENLVSNWVLLHDDTWILPDEVVNWTKAIREGHPEKVDWASLMWYMVEKEVLQGHNLSHCYYASHLQRVLKLQRETLFSTEPVADPTVVEDDDIAEIMVSERGNIEVEMGGSDDLCTVDDEVKMEPHGDMKMVSGVDLSLVKDEVEIEPRDVNVNIGKDDVNSGLDIADVEICEDDLKMRLGVSNMEPHGGDVKKGEDDLKMRLGVSNMEPHGGDVKKGEDDLKMGLDIADVKIGEDDLKLRMGVADVDISEDDVKMGQCAASMKMDDNDLKMQVDVADVIIYSCADVKIGGSDDANVGRSADVNVGGSDDVMEGFSNDVKIGDGDAKTGLDGGDVKIGLDGGELKIGGTDDGDNVNFARYDVNMETNDEDAVMGGDNDVVPGTKEGGFTVEEEGNDMPIGNTDDLTEKQFAEPNVELNLGQNSFIKEELVQDDSMDFEQCGVQEVHQWLNNNNNNMSGHILQPCSQSRHAVCDAVVEKQQELGFTLIPKYPDGDDISSENILEDLDGHSLMEQFTSRGEPIPSLSGPSGFGNIISKREIDHDHDQGNHKRQRMDEQWDDDKLPDDDDKLPDDDACLEMAVQWIEKSRLSKQRQEEARRNTEAHQEYLMNEIHQRDMMIEHLNKVRFEEQQRKQIEVYRLDRELFSMADLLQSYRKALKETRRSFAEYRALHQYPEEPLYKDAEGGRGLVVTCAELERERVKREREELAKLNAIVPMIQQFELEFTGKFELYSNEADQINNDVLEAAKNVQIVKELRSTRGSC